MKILKKIILAFAILIAIPLIMALFIRQDYFVERTVNIQKSKAEVFDYIKFLKNQDNYSLWANMDPKMKKTYKGVDGKVGFISAWESKNEEVGVGEQEIKQINPGKRVDYELRFKVPFESTEHAYMTTEALSENKTKVTWGFTGHINYPFNIWFLFMDFESMIGNDLKLGLNKLKTTLEKSKK